MRPTTGHTRKLAVIAPALTVALASLSLVGCGGSATPHAPGTASSQASVRTTTAPVGTPGTPATHSSAKAPSGHISKTQAKRVLSAFAVCMRAHGAERAPGKGSAPRAQTGGAAYRVALKQCAAVLQPVLAREAPSRSAAPTRSTRPAHPRDRFTPTATLALDRAAACLRAAGIDIPPPNTTTARGGPIFDTSHVNEHSPQFAAAEAKCNHFLRGVF